MLSLSLVHFNSRDFGSMHIHHMSAKDLTDNHPQQHHVTVLCVIAREREREADTSAGICVARLVCIIKNFVFTEKRGSAAAIAIFIEQREREMKHQLEWWERWKFAGKSLIFPSRHISTFFSNSHAIISDAFRSLSLGQSIVGAADMTYRN